MQVLVVGAGVVGLAVAREIASRGHDVVVAEATGGIGNGISSRNSEVIHAGMYYPAGSLRAFHCTEGRRRLYSFCADHGVPFRKSGKLIVATHADEEAKIADIFERGRQNGVEGLEMIGAGMATRLEPALSCTAALLSPETGIVDSHALMLALCGDVEAAGGAIAFDTPVEAVAAAGSSGYEVAFGGREPTRLMMDAVVNAAGLGAQKLAHAVEGLDPLLIPPLVMAKGNYFGCSGRRAFERLIYPAPVDGGLGTHLTLDLAGRMRFGPDVEWIEREDYAVDAGRAEAFYASIRRYWPGLPDGALYPDYAGIRPKLGGPGAAQADFVIQGPESHGLARLVNLFGIESPGLTASLSLAVAVADRVCAD